MVLIISVFEFPVLSSHKSDCLRGCNIKQKKLMHKMEFAMKMKVCFWVVAAMVAVRVLAVQTTNTIRYDSLAEGRSVVATGVEMRGALDGGPSSSCPRNRQIANDQ